MVVKMRSTVPETATHVARAQEALARQGIAALICRLPENILYLSGFWPVTGFSFLFFPAEGGSVLLVPEDELDYAKDAWVSELWSYPYGSLDRICTPEEQAGPALREISKKLALNSGVIGYEASFEMVAVNRFQGEVRVPAVPSRLLLESIAPRATLADATESLRSSRAVKSEYEIERIRAANEVAWEGLQAGRDILEPGISEYALASAVESTIREKGPGTNGIVQVRGYAEVMSGPRGAQGCAHHNMSSARIMRSGEAAIVELGVQADGYWADVTRVFAVGQVDERTREIHSVVRAAQEAAVHATRPGVLASDVDGAARAVVERAGYGSYYPHGLGHGVGLAYHEPPFIHPKAKFLLPEGFVHSVEPGIYIPGWGGIRLEDDVVVTQDGARSLSDFDHSLMEV